jgi:hypothetical protein
LIDFPSIRFVAFACGSLAFTAVPARVKYYPAPGEAFPRKRVAKMFHVKHLRYPFVSNTRRQPKLVREAHLQSEDPRRLSRKSDGRIEVRARELRLE